MSIKAIAGLVLFGALVVGAPAFAAPPPPPNFNFGIHIGPDTPPPPADNNGDTCLSTREIMSDLRGSGYRNFTNLDDSGDSIVLDARRGTRWYELEVDSCSGDILDRSRIPAPY